MIIGLLILAFGVGVLLAAILFSAFFIDWKENKNKASNITSFFKDDKGNNSSMRLVFGIGAVLVILMVLVMVTYILVFSLKGQTVNWSDIAKYLGAVSVFTAMFISGKTRQKKHEKENER